MKKNACNYFVWGRRNLRQERTGIQKEIEIHSLFRLTTIAEVTEDRRGCFMYLYKQKLLFDSLNHESYASKNIHY